MFTALADQPQRASTSFTLAFGILNIPLSVYTGTEETRVARAEYLDGDTNVPVGRSPIRKDTGEVVPSEKVVRMATATSGAQVILTDDEIAACTMPRGVGDIVTFVPIKNVGQYLASDAVQVRPKASKGKPDVASERAFALLLTVMKRQKVAALVKVALRGPARHGLLFADGSFVYVRTADQVRQARPLVEHKFSAQELGLADALVDAVGTDTPVLTDDTAPVVQAYVDRKAQGVAAPVPAPLAAPVQHDLMGALTASIAAAKSKAA